MTDVNLSRRALIQTSVGAAGGLLLGFHVPDAHAAKTESRPWTTPTKGVEVNAWLAIDPDGTVTIRVPHTEMGQGGMTSVALMIAEELDVEWSKVQAVFAELERAGLPAKIDGKGRTCWLSMGYLLAEGHSDVIALHDCDIVNYSREIPAALCYPLAHPKMEFDFCKGYYARTSGKLHGRVTRLFLAPLVEALREHLPESKFLSFLSEFRYPLAGEFALTAPLARKMRMPSDWGLEVGVLSEVYEHAGPSRVCQADIADNYEHKHQDLSPTDSSKGLRRMTFEIAGAMLRCVEKQGGKLNEAILRRVANGYGHQAGMKVKQYEADALMNGLDYDRGEEIRAVTSFGASLEEAIEVRGRETALPAWGVVEWEAPQVIRQLLGCPFVVTEPERKGVAEWLQPVRKPAYFAEVS